MSNRIHLKDIRWLCLLWSVFFILSGCSLDEEPVHTDKQTMSIPLQVGGVKSIPLTRSSHTVNRILILPFKKIDESILENNDGNFEPDFSAAKQFPFNSATVYTTMLNFSKGATYKLLVIGYSSNDYNLSDPDNINHRFNTGSVSSPTSLANFHLLAKSPAAVPEFFTATCSAFNGQSNIGEYFKVEQTTQLKGTMTRIVSKLSMNITNIPNYITSVSLVAEKLVKGIHPSSATATIVETSATADNLKTFSTKIPVSGNIEFEHFLLPTLDLNKTSFYLDFVFGTSKERYLVKVPDTEGVSDGNRIVFSPNHKIEISGSFSKINIGFTIGHSINLDDDVWDGIN